MTDANLQDKHIANLSIKTILDNKLPNLLKNLLIEMDYISTHSSQHTKKISQEEWQQHDRLLKNLSEQQKTLKTILQNITFILKLSPQLEKEKKHNIIHLLEQAESLIDKNIPNCQTITTTAEPPLSSHNKKPA
ncbi:MAG: hypothetical protein ACR2NY_01385 [Alphaproteobacteria bacterium]